MKSVVILFLLLLSLKLCSQNFYGAPMQATANTGLALPSIYGLTANASVISKLKRPYIGVGYQPHFLTNDIRAQALLASLPVGPANTVGLAINNYGLRRASSLLTLRAIYVRAFGDIFSTSVATNYHQYHVKGYGGDNTLSLDLGAHFTINEMLSLGLLFRNVTSSRFEDTIDQYISKEVGAGLLYSISKEVLFTADVYYSAVYGIDPRFGITYHIDNLVVLRGGATLVPTQYFAGIGLTLGRLLFDVSSSFHTRLGASPQLSLAYGF